MLSKNLVISLSPLFVPRAIVFSAHAIFASPHPATWLQRQDGAGGVRVCGGEREGSDTAKVHTRYNDIDSGKKIFVTFCPLFPNLKLPKKCLKYHYLNNKYGCLFHHVTLSDQPVVALGRCWTVQGRSTGHCAPLVSSHAQERR